MSSTTRNAASASTLPEQTITASLTAEIMHDLDDGRPTLVASTQGNQADLQEVTPAELLAKVAEHRAALDRIELLASEYEAATARVTDEPAAWTFTHCHTGEQVAVTCMPGCTINHKNDIDTPTHPVDVFCWNQGDDVNDVTLPIDTTGTPEEYRVLNAFVEVDPFSTALGRRMPFAVVEVVDEHWISGLDPDGLATVINTVAGRLTAMRRTHAQLVHLRAAYRRSQS